MRIAVDLSFFIADKRGMGRVVRNILSELLVSSDDTWTFFVRKQEELLPVSDWIRAVNPDISFKVILSKDLHDLSVDVCWYPWNRVDVKPKFGRRIVMIHDVNPFVFPQKGLLQWWDQRKAEKRLHDAVAAAEVIVTVSNFSKQEIPRYIKTDTTPIKVIPLGVDSKWLTPLSALNFPTDNEETKRKGPRLLYVGSDDERKNLHRLFDALRILHHAKQCEATLICCGGGEQSKQKYRNYLVKLGIENAVDFLNAVSDDYLRELYQKADLFVFPSLYEGFGLPLLEAMAARCPVISSNAASLPEVGGEAAIFFDASNPTEIAETIYSTWINTELCNRLRNIGKERAAMFTWEKAASEFKKILQ